MALSKYPDISVHDYGNEPYIEIIEQPAPSSLIFRYASEILEKEVDGSDVKRRRAGSIVGVHTTANCKTYPTIKVMNYKGPYVVIISLVTKDGPPYRPHPHNLVGTENCKDGICRMCVNNSDMTCSFRNLGIERVKINEVKRSLRIRQSLNIHPFGTGFDPNNIDLKVVRLCFQVLIPGADNLFSVQLQPVVSDPIYHKKDISNLTIMELSHFSASAVGGTKVILLCDRVDKNDIEIWFYEKQGEDILWQGKAQFGSNDVHKSVAIAFKTPPYCNTQIQNSVSVLVELRKPSENKRGEPREFLFLPAERDPEGLARKKFKARESLDNLLLRINSIEQEFQSPIGVPRASRQSSDRRLRFDSFAEFQSPIGVPRASRQTSEERITADSFAGDQSVFATKVNENYPQPCTSSALTGFSIPSIVLSTMNPVAEHCNRETTFLSTTHQYPAQTTTAAAASSVHHQASVNSLINELSPIMEQFAGTVVFESHDANENTITENFSSMNLGSDPGVEMLLNLSTSIFDSGQNLGDNVFLDASSSIMQKQ